MGTKPTPPSQRLDLCLGPCQDTGCFLPRTASGNAGRGCSGAAGLTSVSKGQRRQEAKPNLESFRKGSIGFLLLLSSSLPDWGWWVPEKLRSGSSQREQLGPRPPSPCGLGRLWSGQEQSRAADSCGGARARAPTTWLPFSFWPPLGRLLGGSSPASRAANGPWGFRRRAQRRAGKGSQHLLAPRPSPGDIHFKVTGGAPLSLWHPCRQGALFPSWGFAFQRIWWLGSQVELGEKAGVC